MLNKFGLISLLIIMGSSAAALAQTEKTTGRPNSKYVVRTTQDAYYPKGDKVLYKYIYRNHNLDSKQVPKDLDTDVTLLFTVNRDSSISNFKVLQDPSGLFEEPMTRLFNNTRFVPSLENGEPVVTQVLLKVPFTYGYMYPEPEEIQPVR